MSTISTQAPAQVPMEQLSAPLKLELSEGLDKLYLKSWGLAMKRLISVDPITIVNCNAGIGTDIIALSTLYPETKNLHCTEENVDVYNVLISNIKAAGLESIVRAHHSKALDIARLADLGSLIYINLPDTLLLDGYGIDEVVRYLLGIQNFVIISRMSPSSYSNIEASSKVVDLGFNFVSENVTRSDTGVLGHVLVRFDSKVREIVSPPSTSSPSTGADILVPMSVSVIPKEPETVFPPSVTPPSVTPYSSTVPSVYVPPISVSIPPITIPSISVPSGTVSPSPLSGTGVVSYNILASITEALEAFKPPLSKKSVITTTATSDEMRELERELGFI